jgi:chromosome segregation ATPase
LLLPQDQLNKAQESIEAQRRDAQKQIEAASRDRDNAVDALNTAQRQLSDVNNRLLELARNGPSQAHPVTGEQRTCTAFLLKNKKQLHRS